MAQDKLANTTLIGGGVAAIVASVCCLGPLILVSLGISGAWVSNLTMLEPYRPIFIGIALICMALAYRKIYSAKPAKPARPADTCLPNTLCAKPQTNQNYRIMFWIVSVLVLIALIYPYFVTFLE